ncbi:MAG: GntR family transcriptional regulator [Bacillota bacterium]|jgi:DNA-binding GntR family transcriptional regulator
MSMQQSTKQPLQTPRIKIQSTNEQICSFLKQQIAEGTLEQGQQLNLNQIADALNVSVTPVRDAINLLIHEGFIDKMGNKMFIHAIPEEERSMLEEALIAQICAGYRICVETGKREELLNQLEEALKLEEESIDGEIRANYTFDTVFVRCVGNKFLTQNIVKDFEYYDDLMYIANNIDSEKQRAKSAEEHREIIKLIREERDGDFEPLMRRHYRDVVTID